MTRRCLLFLFGAGVCAAQAVAAVRKARPSAAMSGAAASMSGAASRFLASLDAAARGRAQLAFDSDERLNWHYVPRARQGLPLKEMTPAQQKAALDLLRAGLSEKGFGKAAIIRQLELVLRAIENGNPGRDPELYYFTVFGTPSETGPWGWRYEGHHCSQNWTVVDGTAVASSPQFFGSNPAEVRQGPMMGTRVLAAEEDLARELLASLDPGQRKEAVAEGAAPGDIMTGNQRTAAILQGTGIRYDRLSGHQQAMLMTLISEYAEAQQPELAADRLDKLHRAGLSGVRFAWMGSEEKGKGHYYRIQGSTFLIEFDQTQDDANHIHAVWRDFKGDFGLDVLSQHYEESPHHHGQ